MKVVFEKATGKLKNERREICVQCPEVRAKFSLFGITLFNRKQCGVCKCDIKLKTSLKLEQCPKGKW